MRPRPHSWFGVILKFYCWWSPSCIACKQNTNLTLGLSDPLKGPMCLEGSLQSSVCLQVSSPHTWLQDQASQLCSRGTSPGPGVPRLPLEQSAA